jgi:hypothetical protein
MAPFNLVPTFTEDGLLVITINLNATPRPGRNTHSGNVLVAGTAGNCQLWDPILNTYRPEVLNCSLWANEADLRRFRTELRLAAMAQERAAKGEERSSHVMNDTSHLNNTTPDAASNDGKPASTDTDSDSDKVTENAAPQE